MAALRYGAWGVAAVVVLLLGTLTWRQAGIYRDEITFFSHIIALNPQARNAHLNLGRALYEADRFAGLVLRTVRGGGGVAAPRPGVGPAQYDGAPEPGRIVQNAGTPPQAVESDRAAVAIAPRFVLAHAGMGRSLLEAHKEYRFIFAVIPLWLLMGADLAIRAAAWAAARVRRTAALRWAWSVAGAGCVAVSLAGLLNALPYQELVYRAWS